MSQLASKEQLRMSLVRWALVTVPAVLLLGFLTGTIGAPAVDNAWYHALQRPAMTPPDPLFPAIAAIVLALSGLALAVVLNARGAALRGIAITLFSGQLVCCLIWAPLFFVAHRVETAIVVVLVLFALALATTLLFARIRRGAGWLMLPYLGWICVIGALLWSVHALNPYADDLVPGAQTTQIDL